MGRKAALAARLRQEENILRRMLKKAVQQGRGEWRREAYHLGYVEGLNDARTKLVDFLSILLRCAPIFRD